MTEVTAANVTKHSSGNQIKVTADLSDIQNGYTWKVPHIRNIDDISFFCSTGATEVNGGTISGNTITFANNATLVGKIAVYGR